jgi:hypothetical protein
LNAEVAASIDSCVANATSRVATPSSFARNHANSGRATSNRARTVTNRDRTATSARFLKQVAHIHTQAACALTQVALARERGALYRTQDVRDHTRSRRGAWGEWRLRRRNRRGNTWPAEGGPASVLSQHACEPLDSEIERIESLMASCACRRRQQEVRQ